MTVIVIKRTKTTTTKIISNGQDDDRDDYDMNIDDNHIVTMIMIM